MLTDPYFNRFDIAEAYFVHACEWGEYATLVRLSRIPFRPAPCLSRATLTRNGKRIHALLTIRSKNAYYPKTQEG